MASHIEMLKLAKDPAMVRALAKRLLAIPDHEWNDWEVDFLQNMAKFDGNEVGFIEFVLAHNRQGADLIRRALKQHKQPRLLTMRQREKLVQLRDDAEYLSQYRGMSIKNLIDQCYLARQDLSERNEEFIETLKDQPSIQRRKLGRLLGCCRQLNLIEPYM